MKEKLSKRVKRNIAIQRQHPFANLGPPRAETAQKKHNYNTKNLQWLTTF